MIKEITTIKWFAGENGKAVAGMCSAPRVEVENADWLTGNVEEVVTLNEYNGKLYVKIESGPRTGKIYQLPKKANVAVFKMSENGPAVAFSTTTGSNGEILLV
jgi:hypothetical protein